MTANLKANDVSPVEIILREHAAIRQEILVAMSNRISILSFGLATIGAVFTASIAVSAADSYSLLASLMLVLAVPAIDIFVLFMWMGEYQRMMRGGSFLFDLEHKVNEMAGMEVLTWESHLRAQRLHMKYPYNTTVMLLTVIGVISIGLGVITLPISPIFKTLVVVLGSVIHVAISRYAVRTLSKLRAQVPGSLKGTAPSSESSSAESTRTF